MAQTVRFATLEKFKANELRLLVCSDVAARGLDIGGLSHVFNFDVPHHAEDYVHRIGRTGRAGLAGHAFTIAAPTDRFAIEAIEALTGHAIPPMIVEGLDPVDWAEEDGRKRRGRGAPIKRGAKGTAEGRSRAKPAPRDAAPKVAQLDAAPKAPRRERADPAPLQSAEPAPRERAEPRSRSKPRAEAAPPPSPVAASPSPLAASPPPRHADRRPRRDRDSDEDSGAAVRGFGSDVPAFMLLRPRIVPSASREGDSEA
jgi:superfamily II DNA/RNA helicase